MLEIWQTFVDKFYNFLDELLNWRFNPRQNIGQIKLSAGDFQFRDERNNFMQMWLKKNANIVFHNSNKVSTGLYKLVIVLPRTAPLPNCDYPSFKFTFLHMDDTNLQLLSIVLKYFLGTLVDTSKIPGAQKFINMKDTNSEFELTPSSATDLLLCTQVFTFWC